MSVYHSMRSHLVFPKGSNRANLAGDYKINDDKRFLIILLQLKLRYKMQNNREKKDSTKRECNYQEEANPESKTLEKKTEGLSIFSLK